MTCGGLLHKLHLICKQTVAYRYGCLAHDYLALGVTVGRNNIGRSSKPAASVP